MAANAELADRGAYLPEADALVCADLHLGRDATANVELPLGEQERLPERLSALVARFEPAEVVLAGDLLDAFNRVPEEAARALRAVENTIASADAEVVVVEGNHDSLLDDVVSGPVHSEYRLRDGTLVSHGHEHPDGEADLHVIGHDHPAIEIEQRRQPCYLFGPEQYRGGDLLVLPAFNQLAPGTVVNGATAADRPSPMIEQLGRFRPAVWDPDADETLWFPALDGLQAML